MSNRSHSKKVLVFASSYLDKPIVPMDDNSLDLLKSLNGFDTDFRCNRDYRIPLKASEFENVVVVIADAEIYNQRILNQIGVGGRGSLRLISRYGVGVDYIDLEAATKNGVMVTNCPGCNSLPSAEWTLSTMLDIAGKRIYNHNLASEGKTKNDSSRQDITGKTIGIIGTGNVAKKLVDIMSGFDVKFIAYTPHPNTEWSRKNGIEYFDNPDEVYRESDILTLHATPQDKTTLINEREISLMKPTAFIVNCARPHLVDSEAVYMAVKERRLFGYGADSVWTREDLRLDGLNIITSPHVGADSDLGKYGMRSMSTRAVIDLLSGKIPEHVVNWEVLKHEKWKEKMYS